MRYNRGMNPLDRVIFFGTPAFATPALDRLRESGASIVAVVTAPPKPVGRARTVTPSPVAVHAQELGIPVLTPITLNDVAFQEQLAAFHPGIGIVVAYGKIIPPAVLAMPNLGFLNIHPSLLPELRGPTPVQTAILEGRTQTGVTIMKLDDAMDHGPILAQRTYDIPRTAPFAKINDDLFTLGAEMLADVLPEYVGGALTPQEQDHARSTICKKYTRDDGRIDWRKDAISTFNRIRALSENPGTWTTWNGQTLNIFRAAVRMNVMPLSDQSGFIFATPEGPAVFCGDYAILLEEVQLEGGKRMTAKQFANGRRQFIGSSLL